jgi:mono/diheme cytochrome c family protein
MRSSRVLTIVATVAVASCAPTLPPPEAPAGQISLDQHWTPEQQTWFHHASQGTATFGIPYEWFMALPAPEIGATGWLSDSAYLTRFGFIPSPASQPDNPDGLPIGFARGAPQVDPRNGASTVNPATGKVLTEFGSTCAACHTGQIVYGKTAMTIDGGSAMLDLGKLRTAVGIAILRTAVLPDRFDRFADRVLGFDSTPTAREQLRKQFRLAVAGVEEQIKLEFSVASGSVEEGVGRLDALNRIGNQVFSLDMRDRNGRPNRENYAPTNAPVHFPHIWDAIWFSWAQYDSSIQRPMVRNAGEAMGVGALVNLSNQGQSLYTSSVDFAALHRIEGALSGPYAPGHTPLGDRRFTGLAAPRWPAFLPKIDSQLAAKGEVLYAGMCAGCHLPAPNTAAFWDARFWRPADDNPEAHSFLDLPLIPVSEIGTDPAEAAVLGNRMVTSFPFLDIRTQVFGRALGDVVEKVAQRWYEGQTPPLSAAMQDEMNGYRPNGIRAPMAYRARPLNGIWATAPYLHNASVPNLYALLSPLAERPRVFWLGNRDYDPKTVGYNSTDPVEGGFQLDTSRSGNSNKGHEFDTGPIGNGIIGRRLAPEERLALIEYLKTL